MTINETRIQPQRLEDYTFLYQSVNRRCCPDHVQEQVYGRALPRILTSADRITATAGAMKDPMKEAVESLTFDDWENSNVMTATFGMDGQWPFDSQSQILAQILDQVVVNGFLRSGIQIFLDFHKRHPIDSAIESNRTKDDAYWGDDATADHEKPEVEVEILDLTVMYQSVTPAAHVLSSILRGPSNYYVDVRCGCCSRFWPRDFNVLPSSSSQVPKLNHRELSGGVRHTQLELTIERGTKAIVFFFLHERQLVYDTTSRRYDRRLMLFKTSDQLLLFYMCSRNLTGRCRFPPNCTELKFAVTGKSGFMLQDGLVNPGLREGCIEPSNHAFYQLMRKMGMWHGLFDDYFPRSNEKKPYDQYVVMNLTPYQIKENLMLTVTALFNATGSPKNTRLVAITLQQYLFSQSPSGAFSFEVEV